VVVVFLAVFALMVLSSFRFLRIFFDSLDLIAVLGLFLVNWLGNGGALVPIPGARFIGMLMIFQQAVLLPSWEVFGVAGAAMSLGLLSYYIAGVRTAKSYAEGDTAGAEHLAQQTGMLDEDIIDFNPGGDLDEQAALAIAGVADPTRATEPTNPDTTASGVPDSENVRFGRVRQSFTRSLKKTQERAQPVIEQRGTKGMFLLCFAPTPMGLLRCSSAMPPEPWTSPQSRSP